MDYQMNLMQLRNQNSRRKWRGVGGQRGRRHDFMKHGRMSSAAPAGGAYCTSREGIHHMLKMIEATPGGLGPRNVFMVERRATSATVIGEDAGDPK